MSDSEGSVENKSLSRIFATKTELIFEGEITNLSVDKAIKLLIDNPKINTMELSTGGGNVTAGLRFISFFQKHRPGLKIIVRGYAYSMGTVILGAAKTRIMSKYSILMYHDIASFAFGRYTTTDFRDEAAISEFYLQTLADIINPARCKKIKNFLEDVFSSRKDVYINADEALKLGLIDAIE